MLQRTANGGGNAKTWSLSTWVKRGFVDANEHVLLASEADANNSLAISFIGNAGATANFIKTVFEIDGTDYEWVFKKSDQ